MKFTNESMKYSLDSFGENYKYSVYASINCETGFFTRKYKTHVGFTALTDTGKLLIAEYSAFGTSENKFIFSLDQRKKFKIKKVALLPVYSIKAVFIVDRKQFRLDMKIPLQVANSDFTEQEENSINFIETLKDWQI